MWLIVRYTPWSEGQTDSSVENIGEGARFLTVDDIETNGLVHWSAPFTSGFHCVIPKGTVLVTFRDSGSADALGLIPEHYKEFEQRFVPDSDRTADKYAGYSFVFTRAQARKRLRQI